MGLPVQCFAKSRPEAGDSLAFVLDRRALWHWRGAVARTALLQTFRLRPDAA
jgi:hypothetical protein